MFDKRERDDDDDDGTRARVGMRVDTLTRDRPARSATATIGTAAALPFMTWRRRPSVLSRRIVSGERKKKKKKKKRRPEPSEPPRRCETTKPVDMSQQSSDDSADETNELTRGRMHHPKMETFPPAPACPSVRTEKSTDPKSYRTVRRPAGVAAQRVFCSGKNFQKPKKLKKKTDDEMIDELDRSIIRTGR